MQLDYIPNWVKECYQKAIENEGIKEYAKRYLDSRKALDNDMANLRNIFDN